MDLVARLDSDFVFLMNFIKNVNNNFDGKPEEEPLFRAWIDKLITETFIGIKNKRKRNMYLCNLLMCAEKKRLKGVFREHPPPFGLPDIVSDVLEFKKPAWVKRLIEEDEQYHPRRTTEHKTYLSTRLLQNNQGAVAYLAISTMPDYGPDSHKESEWTEMGTGNFYQMSEAEQKYQSLSEKLIIDSPEERFYDHAGFEGSLAESMDESRDFAPPHKSTPQPFARINGKVYFPDSLLDETPTNNTQMMLVHKIDKEFDGRAKPGDCDLLEYELRKFCVKGCIFKEDSFENMGRRTRKDMLGILKKELYDIYIFGKKGHNKTPDW